MLERWTRAVIRLRFAVLGCWLAIAAMGGIAAIQLPALLTTSLAVPGTSSQTADRLLGQYFGENPEGTFTVVFSTGAASARTMKVLTARVATATRALPQAHAMPLRAVTGVVYGDVVTKLDLQYAGRYTEGLRLALNGVPPAYVTGAPAIQHDLNGVLAVDLRRGEAVAIPAALVILALVLGLRPVLLVPLLFAGSTITAALGVVYLLAHDFLMVSYVPNLVGLVGLGLAVDYSLLFVQRFREEVAEKGRTVDDAIVRTMATAGRAVIFSGTAVAIGLSVVLIMPVPFIRSLGIAGVIVPLISIVAALTLQPALLSLLGRGGVGPPNRGRAADWERRFWAGLARTVMRRRLAVLAAAAVLLALLAAPALKLQLTPGSLSGIPASMPSAQGLALIRDRVGPGVITPMEIVLDTGRAGRAKSGLMTDATLRLATRILQDHQAFLVAIGSRPPYTDRTGRYGRMVVIPRQEFGSEATQQLVRRLRLRFLPAAHFPSDVRIWTGGAPAQGVDFLTQVYGTFPWIVLAVLVLAYIVLLRAFRSLILPLVALLLDVISVAATYGMIVAIFQSGFGAHVLGLYRQSQIEGWLPVFLFSTLFGLSMDYQVFLVTRMRECWDGGDDTAGAIAHGIERTGRIVSAAAVIMDVSFSGFTAGRVAGLQELGIGLALGVLLDATVVRILLMPSIMALLGRWCWWLPAAIARPLAIDP